MKFLLLLTILVTTTLMAAQPTSLKPCGEYAAVDLAEDHKEWTETFNMVNAKGEVVGIYSYRDNEIHAGVCEYIADDNLTVASEWYYWENDDASANPAEFKKGIHYWMAQDEGQAFFMLNNTSSTGEVTVQFSVIGFDEEGDDVELRREILTFKKAY